MIGSNLLRYKDDQLFLLHDWETEGLNLYNTRGWQLAYAICTIHRVISIKVRHLNWPNLNVSPEAARVTRFNMAEHLKIAEDPAVVMRDFNKLRYDPQYIRAGHNILGFDDYVTKAANRMLGLPHVESPELRALDTNALMKGYLKGWKPGPDILATQYRWLNYREKGLKSSLGLCARTFSLEYDERQSHRADYDVYVNHGVLNKLVWSIEI